MAIILNPIQHGAICQGHRWQIDDEDILADHIARVAMGQYRHVAKVLEGFNGAPPKGTKQHAEDALKKLNSAADGSTWQRDGWIFQIISWIAASQAIPANSILRPPHIFKAHKGFDGLQLEVSADGRAVVALVIFEDKATDDPRATIRDDVWPGIRALEADARIGELTHEASTLLETQASRFPNMQIEDAIDKVIWQRARRYRVSITTSSAHESDTRRADLFSGYEATARGDVAKRQAETMHFDNLRGWMDDFAGRIATKLAELGNV